MINVNVEQARLEDVIEIRHLVLHAGQPRTNCYYPEDSYKNTIHFIAKKNEKKIGCASIYKESHVDFTLKQSWRIRGMAVFESYQGQAVGTHLLETCINHAIKMKGDVIWCNAHIDAVKFFKHSGFKIIGNPFEIPDKGPHFLLAKNLGIHIGQTRFVKIAKQLWGRQPEGVPIPQSKIKS